MTPFSPNEPNFWQLFQSLVAAVLHNGRGAFLWTGLSGARPFAILLALFCAAHGIAAKLGWAPSQITEGGRRRIPFAPSVATELIGTFSLRTLQLS